MKYSEGNIVVVVGYPGLSMIIVTKETNAKHHRLRPDFDYVIQRLDENEFFIEDRLHGIYEKDIEKLIR